MIDIGNTIGSSIKVVSRSTITTCVIEVCVFDIRVFYSGSLTVRMDVYWGVHRCLCMQALESVNHLEWYFCDCNSNVISTHCQKCCCTNNKCN